MLQYICPNCHAKIRVGDHQVGKVLVCSKCAAKFRAEPAVPPAIRAESFGGQQPPVTSVPAPEASPPRPRVVYIAPPRSLRRLVFGIIALALAGSGVWAFIHFVEPHKHPRQRLVEKFIREYSNDPTSVEFQSIKYGPRGMEDGVMTQLVLVGFRAKNAFGAKVYQDIVVTIKSDRLVSHGPDEKDALIMASRLDWSNDPDGPKPVKGRR